MSLVDKILGMSYGAIKGIFIGSVWGSMNIYKYLIDPTPTDDWGNDINKESIVPKKFDFSTPFDKFICMSLSLCAIPYSIARGFCVGAYAGYKGGILFSKEKRSHVHNMFDFFTVHAASREGQRHTIGDSDFLRRYTILREGGTNTTLISRNYLHRKYSGIWDGFLKDSTRDEFIAWKAISNIHTFQDILDDPRYQSIAKDIVSKYRWSGYANSFVYTEFEALNSVQLMRFVIAHIKEEGMEQFLTILLDQNHIQREDLKYFFKSQAHKLEDPDESKKAINSIINKYYNPLRTLLMGSHQKNADTPIYESLCKDPGYDKNIWLGVKEMIGPPESEETSTESHSQNQSIFQI